MLVIAYTDSNADSRPLSFLRCSGCKGGYVQTGGRIHPGASKAGFVEGLPARVDAAWQEVRETVSVNAFSAAVMLCRTILFFVAVERGLQARNRSGYAPNFTEVLKHLSKRGIVTPAIEPWVKHIKDIGNDANHDLEPISEKSGLEVVAFTEQLLNIAYAMPAKLAATMPLPPEELSEEAEAAEPPVA